MIEMDFEGQLIFEVDHRDGFVVLTPLVKELTFRNSKNFLSQAKSNLGEPNSIKAILSLENVEIIDSMSLGTLVAVLKHVKKHGGDLIITNISEPIRILFSLLNFNSVFQCYASVDEAVSKYKPEP